MVNTKSLIAKSLLVSASLSSILATAPLAVAETSSNTQTGADSTNIAKTETSNSTNINQSSTANITNSITINANTGYNEANKNTGDGIITTGDITGSLTITNSVNSNTAIPPICCPTGDSSSSNTKTGADSKNISKVEISNTLNINQTSVMNITNRADIKLNTGKNEANKNTGDGIINTGDINFTVGIGNSGNVNTVGNPPAKPGSNPPPGQQTNNPASNPPGTVLAATGGLPVTGGSLPLLPIAALIIMGIWLRSMERELRERSQVN